MTTIRQDMIELLLQGNHSARDMSQILSIREKEVYPHLEHIARSVAAQKKKLRIEAAQCIACEYRFKDRKRFTKPARCPVCKSERISDPLYRIDT
jgi:predicted Zn-ribbon and HTH transcriptional regulator